MENKLNALRAQFPHTRRSIYLNHASTAPLSRAVTEAVAQYAEQRQSTCIENYFAFAPIVQQTRERLATVLGARAEQIGFVQNTSQGLSLLAEGLDWRPGDRVAVPRCEFPANVHPFLHLERRGVAVDFIEHHESTFTLEAVARSLTPRTRVLSVSWVQFLSGYRADLAALSALCKERGVLLCVDAIQGAGALRMNVEALGIDFLACGAQKWMMALQGIGFVYAAPSLAEQLLPSVGWLHGPVNWDDLLDYDMQPYRDARRFEAGTANDIGIAALWAALGLYLEAGMAWCEAAVLANARRLGEELAALGWQRYGAAGAEHASGIVSFRHPEAPAVYAQLQAAGISISVRNNLLRFSPTYYNDAAELERAVEAAAAYAGNAIVQGAAL